MKKIIPINKKKLKTVLLFPTAVFALYLIYTWLIPYALPIANRQGRLVPIYYVDTADKKVAFSFDASWGKETLRHKNINHCRFQQKREYTALQVLA